jgi:tetratricopeptide (TPR) repeat protein
VALADAALAEAKKQHYTPGMRMLRNVLRAYSQAGAADKALDLLNAHEFKEASYVENLGATKSISFYDVSLLDDMARTHINAAVMYFEKADQDARLGASAKYYLAESYLQQGNTVMSLHAAAAFLAQPQQAIAFSRSGQKTEAAAIWQLLAEKSAEDPALLAALMHACTPARADCAKIEKLALAAVEKGEGKKFFSLNAALGKYYLLRKDYPKAVLYMEAGRDKANKNKIEVNDPVMLVGLAEAYYRNKKFSENLEIYFEIGKQYPVVRQIQEAMQGIYSMEQQSAGEVKIF